MKRIVKGLSISLFVICLTSCGIKQNNPGQETQEPVVSASPLVNPSEPSPTSEASAKMLTIEDYYPMKENVKRSYLGEGNEYATYTEFIDYLADGRIQTRTNNGGTTAVEVLEIKDGQLNQLLLKGECYYRENFLKKSDEIIEVLLKEPLVVGTEWTLPDKSRRYISNVEVEITTPAGSFRAIEITTEVNTAETKYKNFDYYAPNVGLVKTVYQSDDMEVSSSLSQVEEETPFTQTIQTYYPNVMDDVIELEEKEISFYTNDVTRTVLEKAIKEVPGEKSQPLLTQNAKFKSLYLNQDNVVYVDFNKEFVEDMNAGSGYESMILQCLTNLLGNYYETEEVYLTVEGESYQSGHIGMEPGETFNVNMENLKD